GDTDPTGSGGTVLSMFAPECSGGSDVSRRSCAVLSGRLRPRSQRRRVRAEHPYLLAERAHAGERLVDVRLAHTAREIGEEHVAAELAAPRARLDLGQVDLAARELIEAAHEPAGT